jgi:hypothetical protein
MKKCKGISKTKGFGCGNEFKELSYSGLCQECLTNWMLETDLGQVYLKKQIEKGKKNYLKEKKQEEKKNKMDLVNWRSKLQTKIQEISRLIDLGQPCLARGYHADQIHGGHIFSKGSNTTMALNLHNIHRQSAQSNTFSNDDGLLRDGLVNEYGEEYFEFIKSIKKHKPLKYLNIEYYHFYKEACEVSNVFKKLGKTFPNPEDRITARNEVNNLLGIYDQQYCEFKP